MSLCCLMAELLIMRCMDWLVVYCCIRGNIYSIEYCNSLISVIAFIEQNTEKSTLIFYCKFPEHTKSGANNKLCNQQQTIKKN